MCGVRRACTGPGQTQDDGAQVGRHGAASGFAGQGTYLMGPMGPLLLPPKQRPRVCVDRCRVLFLHVISYNEPAMRLYTRNAFTCFGRLGVSQTGCLLYCCMHAWVKGKLGCCA